MKLNLKEYFKFKAEFGWAELISTLALIVAALAYFESRKAAMPYLRIEKLPANTAPFSDKNRKTRFFALNPVVITNSGGRPLTLMGLRPNDKLALLYAVRDNQIQDAMNITPEIFLTDNVFEEIIKSPELLTTYKAIGPERLSLLNVPIASGETKILNIGVIIDAYEGRELRADTFLFAVDLIFSDGTKFELRNAYLLKPL